VKKRHFREGAKNEGVEMDYQKNYKGGDELQALHSGLAT